MWGVVYKIDARDGTSGKIVWKMNPGQEKPDRNRGVALWGNLVISVVGYDGRVVATDKETGQVVWDKKIGDQPDLELTAAPLALKDEILIGASGGDNGVRCWLAALDPKTGDMKWKTFMVPAPGEPGSETWKDKAENWRTGGGALYVTGSYDPATNSHLLGHRQSGAALRLRLSPRRQSVHRLERRDRRRDRQDAVALPAHSERQSRLRFVAARKSSSTARSTAKTARSSTSPTATASTTRSTAATASSSRPRNTRRR